jgi:hypothetical protein
MTKQSLYILAFKDEAVIKVGLAIDPWLRIAALGSARFDLSASYLVQCRDKSAVRTLERMLKIFKRLKALLRAYQINGCMPQRRRIDGKTLYAVRVYEWIEESGASPFNCSCRFELSPEQAAVHRARKMIGARRTRRAQEASKALAEGMTAERAENAP